VRYRKKGSQFVEEAAILLLAIILFSTVYTISRPIIQRQGEDQQGIFGQIEDLWEEGADPGRQAPILVLGNEWNGQLKDRDSGANRTDLKRILVGLASDLADPEFRGIAFEEAGRTFLSLVPQSVLGFFHEVEYWRAWWIRKNGGPFEPYDPIANTLTTTVDYSFGVQLAVLDDLTFGGVKAIATYIDTRNVYLALGQTFPGQFYQLLALATDHTVDKETRARALGIAVGVILFIVAVRELGGPIQRAIGRAFSRAWPKVKAALGRIASKTSGLARSIFDELADFAVAAKEKFGELRGEGLTEKAAELAEELADVEDDPEAITASLRQIREWTDGGDPEDLVAFLKETAERSEGLFARKQIRKNHYDAVSGVAEEGGVERAVRVRDDIERIIFLSEEKGGGNQWYTGFLEDIADEVKADVDGAEREIEIVRRALEGDGTAPGRIVKTQDRVRLDIPDSILGLLFDEEGIEPGDLVLVEYDGPDVSFRTIAKYGGDVKGFHALLDDDAGPYRWSYGIATVRKLTDDGFMAFWQERSVYGKIMVENVGGKWYTSIDGKVIEISFKGFGDAGGYIYEDASAGDLTLRYYKDGGVAIGREAGGKKPTFRTIVDAEYDEDMAELVLKLQGREEPYHIYFNDIVNKYEWNLAQPLPYNIRCEDSTYTGIEERGITLLSQDDLIIVNADPNDPKVRFELGQLGERLGRAKVMKIDGGEILDDQVKIPGTLERADTLAKIGDKNILYEFKATTDPVNGVQNQMREGIVKLLEYMSRKADIDEGRVTVFYLQRDGKVIWYEVSVPKG